MDNFEYSIQINDRDWEEFYSTAEECGLMQASLAKEEELWLSDTEDTSICMPSNKHKFIRVSLCPPPLPEEYPAPQISQPVISQSVQTSNKWLGLNEDLLSGSEDEEEFSSVTRFLCQKEYMTQKKESEQRIDIPLPKPVCHDIVTNSPNEHSRIIPVEEDLIEYMRTLNLDRNANYKVDPWKNIGKTTMDKSTNTEEELGHLGTEPIVSIQPGDNTRPNVNPNLSHCANHIESCSSANGCLQEENIPDVNRSRDKAIGKMEHLGHQAPLSASLNNCFNTERGMFDSSSHLKELSSSRDGLVYYTLENQSWEVATKVNANSSAVEQNVPASTIEELHSCISLSDNLNVDVKAIPDTHNSVDGTTSTRSLAPFSITTRAWRNQNTLAPPSSASYRKTDLTLPEMYDFFFDDISDTISRKTESNMECKEGKTDLTLPEMYDFFFDDVEDTVSRKPELDMECREGKTDLTLPEMYDFFFDDVADTISRKTESNMECKEGKTDLTLPEMYDFFFDDVSDTVSRETGSNMKCKEGIMYTPEMYEYLFLEDEEENREKSKGDDTNQESSRDLASSSSAVATWPDACEFFFADGPQDQDRKGIVVSVPSSQVQSAADVIQSFVPGGLKGLTVRRSHTKRGPDGRSFIPQEHPGRSEESNISASGAIAPYLSPGRSDACLVFLALASWAVKSSDLQSSDGWKTALLANIGAVSAIGYLRRRSRRTWQDSPPQTGDET